MKMLKEKIYIYLWSKIDWKKNRQMLRKLWDIFTRICSVRKI